MDAKEFQEFLENAKIFTQDEDLSRIHFLIVVVAKTRRMDDDQSTLFIQELLQIEYQKRRPSNKPEFDRIMRGFRK